MSKGTEIEGVIGKESGTGRNKRPPHLSLKHIYTLAPRP